MSGTTYVSHPALWEQFRHTHRGENFIPTIQRKRKKGGGILNRRRAYMIPVKRIAAPQTEIRQVTPVAAERERAQSDLKETIRNDEPHMPLQKSIKKIPKKKVSVVLRPSKRKDLLRRRKEIPQRKKTLKGYKKEKVNRTHILTEFPYFPRTFGF